MKIGHTGTFFKPGGPYQLGEFIRCRVLDIRTKSLLVELEDGRSVEISKDAFTPIYMHGNDMMLADQEQGAA